MKRARNQGKQPDYCPINLDYIFAKDDPLLPWLETREPEIEIIYSKEESSQGLTTSRSTLQQHRQKPIIEVQGDNSATATDIGDDDDDNDGDNHSGSGGHGTSGGHEGGLLNNVHAEFSDHYFVPSAIPYPHGSTSQSQHVIDNHGKSHIIQQKDEEDEEEEEEEEEEPTKIDSNLCIQQLFYPYYLQEPPPGHQIEIEYESYLFGAEYSQYVALDSKYN